MPKYDVTVKFIVEASSPTKASLLLTDKLNDAELDPHHITSAVEVDDPDKWIAVLWE